jgi:hypothetical protein
MTNMTNKTPSCIYCDRTSDEVPLVAMQFKGQAVWICPQHLPILIHKPAQLAGKLPGVEKLSPPAEGHH